MTRRSYKRLQSDTIHLLTTRAPSPKLPSSAPTRGCHRNRNAEDMIMKKIFALIVAATMGLSSAAFAADTTTAPAAGSTTTQTAPAKTVHHVKKHKKAKKTAPAQTAQAAKKPVKKHKKVAATQTAQAAKKHVKKHTKAAPKAAAATPAA
ncbi:Putative acid shock protein precursor [Sodalis praecaptivus]|uniref:Putative acid shock protein n=2 Tax=Bruguierivoracaceae TaxID=2812006 RepID=W0HT68_9GAMM|nr:Putative acid shock protein precursor [Sodalis praecaptivus]